MTICSMPSITLGWVGIATGTAGLLGLLAIAGTYRGINSTKTARWQIDYMGQSGGLGWHILYPVWGILLGRV